ncbi:hypothetical protein FACS1894206_04030 [Deltaproteobacteria bacterium]|nr:hypothetical protein FACS1894206_04030 [Deltaproteobacteria bacterium]
MLPSRYTNILWWTGYFFVALTMQRHFPGVDALVPGLMISCEENRGQQTFWLFLITLLIQEGTGSLAFGNAILWYGALFLYFSVGRLFFVTGSLFFVVLIAAALGLTHALLLYMMSSLQGFQIDAYRLTEQATAQAFLIPPLYAALSLLRKRFCAYENGI